ncbi:MAG: roadblock/LC7 domain-containing protein [Verrucomicrobiia bacterium]
MFKFLKNIFGGKKGDEPIQNRGKPTLSQPEATIIEKSKIELIQKDSKQKSVDSNVSGEIKISLLSITSIFSEKLKQNLLKNPDANILVAIPKEKILPQLSTGALNITYGELRSLAPAGIFLSNPQSDSEMVTLPLKEIIPNIDVSYFALKPLKEVLVPDDIPDVFTPKEPLKKVKAIEPLLAHDKKILREFPTQRKIEKPVLVNEKKEELQPVQLNKAATEKKQYITVRLRDVAINWKTEITNELESLKILDSDINIPIDELTPQMLTGKVIFSFKKIKNWLSQHQASALSNQDVEVELPMKIMVPLYIPYIKRHPQKTVSVPDDIPDIFISEKPSSTKAPVIVKGSEDQSVSPTKISEKIPDKVETIKFEPQIRREIKESKVKSLNELFGKPDKMVWTPNEVVESVLTLPGVSGAMIALKEGLPVVARLPKDLDPDLLAGMLTKFLSRLSQYISELNLKSLNGFTLYCSTISIFVCERENIYFVVTGNENEDLPSSSQLQAIVDELVKMNKK